MGNLVFQATSGGQITLSGTNTASNYTIAVPAVTGTFVTTGDTGTVTNTMLANSSTTINGTAIALGASGTVTAAAGTLTGTTLASNVVSSSLTSVGTIGTGVWNGTIITGTYGGTGINNGSNTISIAGNVSYTGAFARTVAVTAATSVTLPTSGTIISSVTALPGAVTGTPSSTSYLRGDGTWATLSSNSISNGTSNVTVNSSGGTVSITTAGTTALTVDTSQNLLVGTTSPLGKLAVVGGRSIFKTVAEQYSIGLQRSDFTNGAYIGVANSSSNPDLVFSNNAGTTLATITDSGNLGLGVTPSAWTLFKAQEIGSVGNAIFSTTSGANSAMGMGAGFYYASGNYKYANTGGVPVGMIFNYSANGQIAWVNAASGTVNNNITFNQAMTLDNSGNLAIGTTSAVNSRLYVSNTGVAQLIIGYNNTANNYFDADTQIFRNSSAAERARIDSSGNLLVGDTANATGSTSRLYALSNGSVVASTFKSVNSTYECSVLWNNATSGNNLFATFATETSITSRGSITYNRAGGLVVYNTTSDYRAKDISGPVTNSGSLIDSVPVYMGKMKWATEERPMFIAHETPTYAHTGEKDAVDKDGNPVYQQMDASALIPVMWAEIQSLRKRILTLENK